MTSAAVLKTAVDRLAAAADIDLGSASYLGYLGLKLTTTNSYAVTRDSHVAHLQLTGPDGAMLHFPVVTSSGYLKADGGPEEKTRFVLRVNGRVNRKNVGDLLGRSLAAPLSNENWVLSEIDRKRAVSGLSPLVDQWVSGDFHLRFALRRANEQLQLEVGAQNDDRAFHLLRRVLLPGDYIVFLQRGPAHFDAVGVAAEDGTESLVASVHASPAQLEPIGAADLTGSNLMTEPGSAVLRFWPSDYEIREMPGEGLAIRISRSGARGLLPRDSVVLMGLDGHVTATGRVARVRWDDDGDWIVADIDVSKRAPQQ